LSGTANSETLQSQQTGTKDEEADIEEKAIQAILEAKPHQQTNPRDRVDVMGRNPM